MNDIILTLDVSQHFRSLANNKLIELPASGDFEDLILSHTNGIRFENNRIIAIPPRAFRNIISIGQM